MPAALQLCAHDGAADLARRCAPGAASTPSVEPTSPAEPASFETMSKAERQSFDAALALEPTDARSAWQIAKPLFESHPTVREVQGLRCRLAKVRKFYPAVIEAHCARLEALGPPSRPRAKP